MQNIAGFEQNKLDFTVDLLLHFYYEVLKSVVLRLPTILNQ